ncbi:Fibrinogen silencer-binding protein [Liparis tanakae]|uniref:Fibrinogen silencer-binding protein n=1 Tax=Liparis tanakae TaxID=230148 RepID=A0A4Z2IF21_9TELE|nr:Fibrinogen silencer-binding protein [Liparis tanakae]
MERRVWPQPLGHSLLRKLHSDRTGVVMDQPAADAGAAVGMFAGRLQGALQHVSTHTAQKTLIHIIEGCQEHNAALRSSQPALGSREVYQHQHVMFSLKLPSLLQSCRGLWLVFSVQRKVRKMSQNMPAKVQKSTEKTTDLQEVMQRRHAQPEYRSSISEPTRKIMEMIPHLFHHVPIHEKDQALRRLIYSKHNSPVEHPGSSSSLAGLQDYSAAVPSIPHEVVQLDPEEDVKPPPDLPMLSTHTESPDRFRSLHLAKEEHELVLANHRKVAIYLEEKREGLKRKQDLEEELLRAKIKVEKIKAARLRNGLPIPL